MTKRVTKQTFQLTATQLVADGGGGIPNWDYYPIKNLVCGSPYKCYVCVDLDRKSAKFNTSSTNLKHEKIMFFYNHTYLPCSPVYTRIWYFNTLLWISSFGITSTFSYFVVIDFQIRRKTQKYMMYVSRWSFRTCNHKILWMFWWHRLVWT